MNDVIESVIGEILEVKWSGGVKTKWEPPEGFFKKSASAIASGLMSASDNLKQAMSRLNFYINRAGKNLSAEDKSKLDKAKEILSKKKAASVDTSSIEKLIDSVLSRKENA